MRISITGEKELIQRLEATLKADETIKTEPRTDAHDRTELEFGIEQAANIVTIMSGITPLIIVLVEFSRRFVNDKPQRVVIKTTIGTVTIDLRPDITDTELQRILRVLGPKR